VSVRIQPTPDLTLAQLFIERVRATPQAPAYRQFLDGRWVDWTWGEAGLLLGRWRAALRKEGLRPGERVAICVRNRLEWVLFDQAALGLGLVVVPLFYNDRTDNMAWCMNDAGVRLLLLGDGALWTSLGASLPGIQRVVYLEGDAGADARAVTLDAWLSREGEELDAGPAHAGDMATLVYTSGTTGRPKGVMLSHYNIISNAAASVDSVPIVCQDDRFLSFLPLSHMFERTVGYYFALLIGCETAYARGIPELSEDLVSQRPTLLVCVPRIFERIYSKVQEGLPAGSFKRRLFERAVDIGWKRFCGESSDSDDLWWPLFNLLVARKLRARLGGRVRVIVVGAAALAPHLSRTFNGLGLPIIQGYGLTEYSPVVCCNRLADNDPLSVGRPLSGVEVKTLADGELLVRGPSTMLGYWNNPVATDAMIDKEGWLHTGDLVRIKDGRIYITGRAKEIIVLSNGEKVPPSDAEQAILKDPVFEQVMVVGEGRGHLGLLVVSPLQDETELCRRANEQLRTFPGYAKIRHLARVNAPWTVENELLTPTLKLRRSRIEAHHATDIESMYRLETLCRMGQE
jgi:long-chain acyl-CoA synthetase